MVPKAFFPPTREEIYSNDTKNGDDNQSSKDRTNNDASSRIFGRGFKNGCLSSIRWSDKKWISTVPGEYNAAKNWFNTLRCCLIITMKKMA